MTSAALMEAPVSIMQEETSNSLPEKITFYTTETCPGCKVIKKKFDREGVPYEAIDITHDADKIAELKAEHNISGIQAPFFVVGDLVFGGMQPDRIREAVLMVTGAAQAA